MRLTPTLAAILAFSSSISATPTQDGLYAVIDTSLGEITFELYYELAPLSCASFVGLATGTIPHYHEGSDTPHYEPFYDGLTFHSVDNGFVIIGGSPDGSEEAGPGFVFPDEVSPLLSHDSEGILAMSNSGPNSNGSQFFMTLAATPELDGQYNVFGKIVEGLESLRAIGAVEVDEFLRPTQTVSINTITILRIGDLAKEFVETNYADFFDPFASIYGHNVPCEIKISETGAEHVIAELEYEPLTHYYLDWSDDLANWEEFARALPSISTPNQPASVIYFPNRIGEKKFVKAYASRGGLIDIDSLYDTLKISSPNGDETYEETIDFQEGLVGTYTVDDEDYPIEYDWWGINQNRTQVLIYFTGTDSGASIIQYFLDWNDDTSGTVYIHDSIANFVGQGTFSLTY